MIKKKDFTFYKTGFLIFIGTALLAFSVKCIYDPSKMVTGGFSGLAILIKELTSSILPDGIPLGLTVILLNAPLFVVAYILKGRLFVQRTAIATLLVSVWLFLLPEMNNVAQDYILVAIFGGVVSGAGVGMVLSTGSATGGTDMIASLLVVKMPGYSIAQITAMLDGVIILVGAFLFGLPVALYAILSVYTASKVSDGIVSGIHFAKSVYIITEKPEKVADAIMLRLHRGVTNLQAVGMYTGEKRNLLFCVVSKKEIVQLKEIVYHLDKKAFVIVSEAKEVLGEGFIEKI